MFTLGIILARAGSKGLPDKCIRLLLGRPLIEYTIDHALAARRLDAVVLSTDSPAAQDIARRRGITVVQRPAELASDTATVDAAARHAVTWHEHAHAQRIDAAVLLYGNIPVRAPGVIDRAVQHLAQTGADSVRTLAPVSKQHPDWLHRLEGDRMVPFRPNSIYRRQDLAPLYYHDGAVIAVTRAALFAGAQPGADPSGTGSAVPDPHAFFGNDRRAIVQPADATVDVDEEIDLNLAEALLRSRTLPEDSSVASTISRATLSRNPPRRMRSARR
ncbi:MAG TPA: acylneuraminate cytidylyltransferase family protein [Phycisphaerae bacterium]|jgi:CMP-N-acetylneuraminic acid synthetase